MLSSLLGNLPNRVLVLQSLFCFQAYGAGYLQGLIRGTVTVQWGGARNQHRLKRIAFAEIQMEKDLNIIKSHIIKFERYSTALK